VTFKKDNPNSMGKTCSTYVGDEKWVQYFSRKTSGEDISSKVL